MPLSAERLTQRCLFCTHNIPRHLRPIFRFSGSQNVRAFSSTQLQLRKGGQSKKRPLPDNAIQALSIRRVDDSSPPRGSTSWLRGNVRDAGLARSNGWQNRGKRDVDMEGYTGMRFNKFRKDFRLYWSEEMEGEMGYKEALEEFDIYEGKVLDQDFTPESEDLEPDVFLNEPESRIPTPRELRRAQSVGEEVFDCLLRERFREFALREAKMPILELQKQLTDMQHPHEWYPETRSMQRTWILHVGPTNSGKTYQALKRLENCTSGIYAGPLRLLAHEIYERFNAKGISCNLITGEEQRVEYENAKVTSSTVEMVDMNRTFDVAVLDEIQMIGDKYRGWAWTQALLGVKAKEVHMCGEERTVQLIQNLVALTGDKLIINRYKRLGPLNTATKSLEGDWKEIEKGDCVVTFTRKDIFAIKKTIEETTGKRCAVVYGGLPPETRSHQAKLFNDPSNEYDVLVASDAVGMGLNLSIQRVIFETLTKYDGESTKALEIPHIKQIGGRAGRYRVAPSLPLNISGHGKDALGVIPPVGPLPAMPNPGIVTAFESVDMKLLTYAMKANVPPIRTAGIHPPGRLIEKFAKTFPPRKPFSQILEQMIKHAKINSSLFHLCSVDELMHVAGVIEGTKGLTIAERITITQAPLPKRDVAVKKNLMAYSKLIAESRSGGILDVEDFQLDVLDEYLEKKEENEAARGAISKMQGLNRAVIETAKENTLIILPRLESLHKSTMLWLWLSYRFPAVFTPRETAFDVKKITEDAIQDALSKSSYDRARKLKKRAKQEKYLGGELKDILGEEEQVSDPWVHINKATATASAAG